MYYLISGLRNIEDIEGTQYLVNLHENNTFTIAKNHPITIEIFKNHEYVSFVGKETIQEIMSNFIAIQLIDESYIDAETKYVLLNNLIQLAQAFSLALWFIKDNAVTPNMGTISSSNNNPQDMSGIIRRNVFITNSVGRYRSVSFEKKELDEAMEWYGKIFNLTYKTITREREFSEGYDNLSNFMSFDVSSFERAIYFLHAARGSDFLLSKITNYISLLECLLAANGDNTHKVSERAAILVGVDDKERKQIFKEIVGAYNLRSKYIHGSEIKKSKHEDFPETSKKLDDIVRRVLKELMLNRPELNYNNSNKKDKDRKNFEEVNEWFNELILTKDVQ